MTGRMETSPRNFVILDSTLLTVDPKTVKDIRVVETIKEGKTILRGTLRTCGLTTACS